MSTRRYMKNTFLVNMLVTINLLFAFFCTSVHGSAQVQGNEIPEYKNQSSLTISELTVTNSLDDTRWNGGVKLKPVGNDIMAVQAIELIGFVVGIIEALKGAVNDEQTDNDFKEVFGKLDRNFKAISNVQETIDRMMVYSMDSFELIQKKLNKSTEEIMKDIDEVDRKVDRNFGYLLEMFKIVSETYEVIEKTRIEMHEEFNWAFDYAKRSRIEPIINKLNNFVEYFSDEKARISQMARDERIANLKNGFLQFLRKSRTPRGDSLQSFLYEVMHDGYTIPTNTNDTIAYAALSSMYYGVQTEISVMRYLVRVNMYLMDDSYRKRNIEDFNGQLEQLLMDYDSFRYTLAGSSGLIDKAIVILKGVAKLGFPGIGEGNSPEDILKRVKYLEQEKLNITDSTLPLITDVPDKLTAHLVFDKESLQTPIGPWIDGAKVSYAVQFKDSKNMYSKVGEWSEPFSVNGQANPRLRIPAHSTYARLIFRRFNNENPQFVGMIEQGTQTEFWDIDRDLFNAASGLDELKALNEAMKFIASGANISAQFDLSRSAIHAAAQNGNIKFSQSLLPIRSDLIAATDANGNTPLHIAADSGWADFVGLMIQHGASVNAKTHSGSTPLHLAVTKGYPEAVQVLLKAKNIDINAQDEQNAGPLHKAVQNGIETILQTLLDDSRVDVNLESNGNITALHLSAMLHNNEITSKIVHAHGTKINHRSNGNMSALHYATISGNLPALKLLIGLDCTDVNAVSVNGWTPLHYAVSLKRSKVVFELLKLGNVMVNVLGAGQISPLHLAAATDQDEVVKQLLESGAEIDLPTSEGLTALHLAVINTNKDIVRRLLSKGADINWRTSNGSTVLHTAAARGDAQIIKCILELGNVSINLRNSKMETPLNVAIRLNHSYVAELLKQNIDGINSRLITASDSGKLKNVTFLLEMGAVINTNDSAGETPLHKAVSNGHMEVVEYLVKMGADVNSRDVNGETPLHKSARLDHVGLIRFLAKMGADVNAQSGNGWSPLHWAISLDRSRIVDELLKLSNIIIDLPSSEWLTPLHLAAMNGSSKYVDDLLAKGAMVDLRNKEGLTPLQLAAIKDHRDIVAILLQKGANLNIRTANGSTVLHLEVARCNTAMIKYIAQSGDAKINVKDDNMNTPLVLALKSKCNEAVTILKEYIGDISNPRMNEAAQNGLLSEIKSLLMRGADAEGTDKDGRTPLLWAAAKGHLDIVMYLVESAGAIVDARDNGQGTPLYWGAYWGHLDVVEYLVDNGAYIDAEDEYYRTPLFYAAFNGYYEVAYYLGEKGANVNIRNKWGESALWWARRNGHSDIASYLVSKGAN